jgi:signal transduction histidine kinase/CheY-like chemotaxis protein
MSCGQGFDPVPGSSLRLSLSSLRTRLLLLVAAAYVPAAILTVWTIRSDREEALAEERARLARLLAQADADSAAAIVAGRRIVATWAQVPDIVSGSSESCDAALARLLRFAPMVASPTRINARGIVDCGGRSPQSRGRDVSGTPIFNRLAGSDSVLLGPYLPADSTRVALLPINMPLRDEQGRFTGVVSVGIRLDWFDRLARNSDLPPGSLVTIADSTGLLVAHFPSVPALDTVRPGLNVRFREDLEHGREERGSVVRTTLDGVEQLVSHERLESAPGTVVRVAVAMPPNVAFAEPNRRARVRVAMLVAAVIVALLVAWYGAHVVVLRDVEAILGATRRLGAGDLAARTGLTDRTGEIGQLAESFDTMASQLEYRQDRMRHAERLESLGTLAGGVAHDFNNMLTAIVGSADLALEQCPPNHPAHDDLLTIKSSANRSSSLTRQLLDFSRRTPLVSNPQCLHQLVHEAASLLGRVVPASVLVSVRTTSTRLTRIDAGRIEQAIVNLAVKARDAMPDGGTLTITLDDEDVAATPDTAADGSPVPPGHWLRLRVSDTGIGMSPEVQRRIFEPFFTTKAPGEGTGLGLAMVYGTVQQHGGHIQVNSVAGQGTTFTIWLPEAVHAERAADELAAPVMGVAAPLRVLVAEDQPEVRSLIERVLTRAGYAVVMAPEGHSALALGHEMGSTVGVLVTDYDMPGMRGDLLAVALRAQRPELPVVLMSGFASEGWPAELVNAPHTALVEKPFTPQQLTQAVQAACEGAACEGAARDTVVTAAATA